MLLQSAQIKVKKLLVDDKIRSCVREIGLLGIVCLNCIVFLLNIPCCRRFLRVLIFAVFPVICANKFPQTFFPQKLTPESIFSNLNSLHKNTGLTNHVCSITTCLFHSETTKYWFIAWKINMFFYCRYSIKTKILSMLGMGYFLKIAKINSQQEKPICPNCKN